MRSMNSQYNLVAYDNILWEMGTAGQVQPTFCGGYIDHKE